MKKALKVILLLAFVVSCRQEDVTPDCLFGKSCLIQSYHAVGIANFTYKYDGDNILKEIISKTDNNPEKIHRTLEFNGCLLKKSSLIDTTTYTTYQYDELGRLTKVDFYGFDVPIRRGWSSGYRIQYDNTSDKPKKIAGFSTPKSVFGTFLAEIVVMDNGAKAQKDSESDYEFDANGNVSKKHTYVYEPDATHTKRLVSTETYTYDDKTNNMAPFFYLMFDSRTIPYGFSKNNVKGIKIITYYSGPENAEPDIESKLQYDNSGNITTITIDQTRFEDIVWKCR